MCNLVFGIFFVFVGCNDKYEDSYYKKNEELILMQNQNKTIYKDENGRVKANFSYKFKIIKNGFNPMFCNEYTIAEHNYKHKGE